MVSTVGSVFVSQQDVKPIIRKRLSDFWSLPSTKIEFRPITFAKPELILDENDLKISIRNADLNDNSLSLRTVLRCFHSTATLNPFKNAPNPFVREIVTFVQHTVPVRFPSRDCFKSLRGK
jgi:hypothetical protein